MAHTLPTFSERLKSSRGKPNKQRLLCLLPTNKEPTKGQCNKSESLPNKKSQEQNKAHNETNEAQDDTNDGDSQTDEEQMTEAVHAAGSKMIVQTAIFGGKFGEAAPSSI